MTASPESTGAAAAIVEYPDERLRQYSAPVTQFDDRLSRLVRRLFETLAETGGIGLSAPQIGIASRVSVVQVKGDDYGPRVYVNPRVLARSALGIVEESCLSVPGVVGNVMRSTRLRVVAQDASGQEFEAELAGMHAVCLQHEMDHLDGKLFIDRLWWFRRLQLRYKFGKNQHRVA